MLHMQGSAAAQGIKKVSILDMCIWIFFAFSEPVCCLPANLSSSNSSSSTAVPKGILHIFHLPFLWAKHGHI